MLRLYDSAKRVFRCSGCFRPKNRMQVNFLEIDLHKPDFQTLRAALELLNDDYLILFPGDAGNQLLVRQSAANLARLKKLTAPDSEIRLALSEDADANTLAKGEIPSFLPDYGNNRAFHTLVQLCDYPLLVATGKNDRTEAAAAFPEIEYAFWPLE